jgi:hypothetical protein
MTSSGLLSGSADRAQRLCALLKDAGADPVVITDPAELPGRPSTEGLDFYIQLPITIHPEGHRLSGLAYRSDGPSRSG